ncbi:metalloprotease ImpA [Methylosoma difficile]
MFVSKPKAIAWLPFCLLMAAPVQATLNDAVSTGDPSLLPALESEIVDAALSQIKTYQTNQNKLLDGIYGSGAISYVPGNRTQLLLIQENETVFPLLSGNKGKVLAVRGSAGGGRFAALGSEPTGYFLAGKNLAYEESFKRILGWLLTGTAGDTSRLAQAQKVALTFTGGANTGITKWLGQKAAPWATKICNDPATISICYQNQDLLIVSWESNASTADNASVLAAIKAHMALKKPVLYVHTWYEGTSNFSDIVSAFLGFSLPYGGNYWDNDAANFTQLSDMQAGQDSFAGIQRLLTHFKNQDFHFDWSICNDDRSCKNMPDLVSEFYNGAEAVKQQVAAWEQKNLDVFAKTGRKLGKLLVLLGDKYRAGINYPMHKGSTDDTTFLKALYADHAAYITRKINPRQADLGSFSGKIPEVLPTISKTLTLTTRTSAASSSTGYYALAGQTITLTRKDSNPAKAYAHINMLRSGAAHVFDTYDRPLFLWSTRIPLEKGKAVKINSPYGGIIFLNADSDSAAQKIQVAGAGLAVFPSFTGTNAAEFTSELASTPLNWAELKFPGIEIHSRLDLLQESIADPLIGGNLSRLLDLTQTYLYKDIYGLAGFVGTGLTQPAKVLAFCTSHGWDCTSSTLHGMSNIQHVNADRANCGYGCSGNPYDQYWAYTPLGWGESHEIGHNLQRGRLKIYDGASTEVSNNIFPVHKWWRFNKEATETTKYGRDLGFLDTFNALQQAALTADPVESARTAIWVNGGVFQRLVFYWQMAMGSSNLIRLGDSGWDLFRLMYIHERLFTNAIGNDTNWAAQRTALGFSQYPSRPTAITGNDFMLVSMSYITNRDQRPFFDMWGVKYSTEASAQVASYGLTAVKKNFWVVADETLEFKDPLPTPVLVNGTNPWPL